MSKWDRYATRAGWLVLVLAVAYVGGHVLATFGIDLGRAIGTALGVLVFFVLVASALFGRRHTR